MVFVIGISPNAPTLRQFAFQWSDLGGEHWWRLVSSMFVHGSLAHLTLNMLFLVVFGAAFERKFGPGKLSLVYLGSGVAGALLNSWFHPTTMLVGASGALYGLMGVFLLLDPFAPQPILFVNMPGIIGAAAYIALLPFLNFGPFENVAHLAHLGGLAFGAVCALFIDFRSAIRFVWGVWMALIGLSTAAHRLVTKSAAEDWSFLVALLLAAVIGLASIWRAYAKRVHLNCDDCRQDFYVYRESEPRTYACPHCHTHWTL